MVCLSARTQTAPELKGLCTRYQLPKTGKKQDLIDSLARHLGGGAGAGARGDNDGGDSGNAKSGGSGACEHGRQRSRCKSCGGRGICKHGRQKARCKECGGSGICEHGRQRTHCKECGGSALCEHGRQRTQCKECGGSGICGHGRIRYGCKDCKAAIGGAAQAAPTAACSTGAAAAQATEGAQPAAAGNNGAAEAQAALLLSKQKHEAWRDKRRAQPSALQAHIFRRVEARQQRATEGAQRTKKAQAGPSAAGGGAAAPVGGAAAAPAAAAQPVPAGAHCRYGLAGYRSLVARQIRVKAEPGQGDTAQPVQCGGVMRMPQAALVMPQPQAPGRGFRGMGGRRDSQAGAAAGAEGQPPAKRRRLAEGEEATYDAPAGAAASPAAAAGAEV
jgi:hypothetical protein